MLTEGQTEQFYCQLVRGVFSGQELERYAWETTWLDWQNNEKEPDYYRPESEKLPRCLRHAAYRLKMVFPGADFNVAYLEKHNQGKSSKLVSSSWQKADALAILSLAKFRGGRSMHGPFSGYLNPGEVLYIQANQEATYQSKVDKILEGERLVLVLGRGQV